MHSDFAAIANGLRNDFTVIAKRFQSDREANAKILKSDLAAIANRLRNDFTVISQ
jgi:hypothetical protein